MRRQKKWNQGKRKEWNSINNFEKINKKIKLKFTFHLNQLIRTYQIMITHTHIQTWIQSKRSTITVIANSLNPDSIGSFLNERKMYKLDKKTNSIDKLPNESWKYVNMQINKTYQTKKKIEWAFSMTVILQFNENRTKKDLI